MTEPRDGEFENFYSALIDELTKFGEIPIHNPSYKMIARKSFNAAWEIQQQKIDYLQNETAKMEEALSEVDDTAELLSPLKVAIEIIDDLNTNNSL